MFREAGADDQAQNILFALRQREWAGVFAVAGTLVLWSGSAGPREKHAIWAGSRRRSPAWCAMASLDEILPVVELDKAHTEFINKRLSGWRLYYFYGQRVAAYELGSIVVAGLAGLTQGT